MQENCGLVLWNDGLGHHLKERTFSWWRVPMFLTPPELLGPHRLRGLSGHSIASVAACASGTHFAIITTEGLLFTFGTQNHSLSYVQDATTRASLGWETLQAETSPHKLHSRRSMIALLSGVDCAGRCRLRSAAVTRWCCLRAATLCRLARTSVRSWAWGIRRPLSRCPLQVRVALFWMVVLLGRDVCSCSTAMPTVLTSPISHDSCHAGPVQEGCLRRGFHNGVDSFGDALLVRIARLPSPSIVLLIILCRGYWGWCAWLTVEWRSGLYRVWCLVCGWVNGPQSMGSSGTGATASTL